MQYLFIMGNVEPIRDAGMKIRVKANKDLTVFCMATDSGMKELIHEYTTENSKRIRETMKHTKKIKTFDKIFRIRLAVAHFSCIHFFNLKISHLEEILDLLSKNDVENMIIQALCVWIERFPLITSRFRRHFRQ